MDAVARVGFVETLEQEQRPLDDVLQHSGFYRYSSRSLGVVRVAVAWPVWAAAGRAGLEGGSCWREVLFVGDGQLRVFVAGESGREVTLYQVGRGESCPVNLSAALMGIGAFAAASACGDLSGVVISADRFRQIAESNSEVRDYVLNATVLRFGEIISLIREITTRRVDQRLAEYLLRRFAESADSPPVVEVTQQAIATELGTAREVVSRRLQELDSTGAVRLLRGRIILENRRALHRIIG